jgi:hypothetical protein
MSSTHRAPVVDPWQRIGRTVLQVAGAIITLAPVYPAITAAIAGPLAQAASAGWVVTVAAIIAGLMSIPRVNALLSRVNLGAVSPAAPALDSETRAISLAELQAARELAAH